METGRWIYLRRIARIAAAFGAAVVTSACKPQIPLPATDSSSTTGITLASYPPQNTIVTNDNFQLTPGNGTAPYTFRRISGNGSLTDSGLFTAPSTAGTVTLQVADSAGLTQSFNFTIAAPLTITEGSSFDLATGNTWTFHTTGGAGSVTFSITLGGGSTTAAGAYTAPGTTGTATLRATDQASHTADISIVIHARPQISPTSATIGVTKTQIFTTTNGVAPITYSVVSGGGTFSGGTYTAGNSPGPVLVKATDARGNISTANITVVDRPLIAPTSLSLSVNNTFTFTATAGFTPYVYSVISGGGTINSSTGLYTAPANAGTAVVRVTDAVGNYTEANVTITPAIQINPAAIAMAVNDVKVFTVTGGVAPFVYSVVGTGTVNSTSGSFTAPSSPGTTKVRVTDARGNTSDANITVNAGLTITPTTLTVAVNDEYQFSASGGVSPYTYSLAGGTGSVTSGGHYTAPASTGTSTIRVTDSFGNTANATVTVNPALTASATYVTISSNNTTTITAANGVPGYAYSVVSGPGSIDGASGLYSPGAAGTAVLRATDTFGNVADITITVSAALSITPSPASVVINENRTFSGVGGVAPYTYQVLSGSGTIVSSTGVYTAPGTPGTATIRVTDVRGNTADATVTITKLVLSATPTTIAANDTATAAGAGGTPTYTYSLVTGPGSIDASTGIYTPGASGSATLRVTDSVGRTATTTVTVNPALTISADHTTIAATDTATATGANGVGPYTYSLVSGPGSVNSSTGVYTPGAAGTGVVRVTDYLSNTADVTITVNPALTISTNRSVIATNNTATVTAANGVPAYSYVVVSGPGGSSVTSGGVFTPGSAGTAVVRAYDALGNQADVTITINGPLAISPSSIVVMVNGSTTFSTTGGVPPVTYSVVTGSGSVGSSSGTYTAPASTGSATVRATDSLGNTSNASITIVGTLLLTITANTTNYNIRTAANAAGWVPNQDVQLTINSGVVVSSSSSSTPALTTGTFSGTTKVTIVNNGSIIGAGGAGGGGATIGSSVPGGSGGNAVNADYAVSINNTSGNIFGGGGGGGSGAAGCDVWSGTTYTGAGGGGGGGAGTVPGSGGAISGSNSGNSPAATAGFAASAGSSTGGNGGSGGVSSNFGGFVSGNGGDGGAGGSYGTAGSTGGTSSSARGGCPNYQGGAGGAPGKAVNSNANTITWLGGQNATQVKGATN